MLAFVLLRRTRNAYAVPKLYLAVSVRVSFHIMYYYYYLKPVFCLLKSREKQKKTIKTSRVSRNSSLIMNVAAAAICIMTGSFLILSISCSICSRTEDQIIISALKHLNNSVIYIESRSNQRHQFSEWNCSLHLHNNKNHKSRTFQMK